MQSRVYFWKTIFFFILDYDFLFNFLDYDWKAFFSLFRL